MRPGLVAAAVCGRREVPGWCPAAKSMLATKGYDPQLGARPLRRAIQRMLEDPLSEKVLFGEFPANSTVLVDLDPDDAETLTFAPVETPDQPPLEMAESEG